MSLRLCLCASENQAFENQAGDFVTTMQTDQIQKLNKFSLTNWAGTLFQKKGLNFTLDCTATDRPPGTPSIARGGGGGIPPWKGGGGGGMLPEADLVASGSPFSSAALRNTRKYTVLYILP